MNRLNVLDAWKEGVSKFFAPKSGRATCSPQWRSPVLVARPAARATRRRMKSRAPAVPVAEPGMPTRKRRNPLPVERPAARATRSNSPYSRVPGLPEVASRGAVYRHFRLYIEIQSKAGIKHETILRLSMAHHR